MNARFREVQYFFTSQYFTDGLRITLGVLLPAFVFAQFGLMTKGVLLSLGAFGVSITDSPGPVQHRRNGILLCSIFAFLVAFLTGYLRSNDFLLGLEIFVLSFFFSMFSVYGSRAGSIGTAVLLVLVLTMNQDFGTGNVVVTALLVLAGGLWYLLLSLVFSRIMPYRAAQQALGECIHETAKFLRLKAAFYHPSNQLDDDYRQVVAQQIAVSEKQDAVREMLFKSRQMVRDFTNIGRRLVLTFVDIVDLYEQVMTIHYDYAALRRRFGKTGVLEEVAKLIEEMADELDELGLAIQSNSRYRNTPPFSEKLEQLKASIDRFEEEHPEESSLPLKKILVNLRNLSQRLQEIQHNYLSKSAATDEKLDGKLEYSRFVSSQNFQLKILRHNLDLRSAIFKHALRMAVACTVGFAITRLVDYGHHSYWIILTIIIILKPAFSLTRQRNYQRLTGTFFGGILGVLILFLVDNMTIQFILMVLFLLGTYTFLRINYMLMVVCVTPFVLVLFNFLGTSGLGLAQERLIDTLLGCAVAFAANYLIFPNWESDHLKQLVLEVAKANALYLHHLTERLSGKPIETQDYKLSRKRVYVSAANLSAAFQRMLSEPKTRQQHSKEVYEYVVLNHILSSYIATVVSTILERPPQVYPTEYLKPAKRALQALQECLKKLAPDHSLPELTEPKAESKVLTVAEPEDELMQEQLEFIQKLSQDICKTTELIFSTEKRATAEVNN
ncbi:FUSC family membrane protein [Nafulsella turpanensis]|uniref:FUSC family membrane protein n=1 Tax=Nafulsella turpanensis TaxID=1265690 RepID=UPI00058D1993|nr:FUSC family membrane protein [Nafulsella turpanensis]